MSKKLLIVTYGGGHLNIQLRIAEYFSKRNWEIVFLATPNTVRMLKKLNKYQIYSFKDLLDETSYSIGEELVKDIHDNPNIDYEESLAYSGVNYKELIEMYGEEEAKILFDNYGRRIFFPVNSIKKFIVEKKPDLVSVTFSSARAERATIQAAKELNVKVMAIEDLFGTAAAFSINNKVFVDNEIMKNTLINTGIPSERIVVSREKMNTSFIVPSFHTGFMEFIGIGYEIFPDYVFCINNYAKEQLVRRSVPESIVHIVGQPVFDNLISNFKSLPKVDRNVILITAQPLNTEIKFLDLISNSLFNLSKDYQIIIRNHPSTDGELEKEYFKSNPNIIVSNKENLVDLFNASKLVITQTSTTAIVSSVLGCATLTISINEDNFIDFEAAGIAKTLKNPNQDEVDEYIARYLTEENLYKPNGILYCDGKTTERIFNIVSEGD